jgi:hypothetical protein
MRLSIPIKNYPDLGQCVWSMLLLRDNFDIVRKSEQAAFTSENVGSILVAGPCEESVYSLPKVMGFSPDAPVSSHRESSQGGLG